MGTDVMMLPSNVAQTPRSRSLRLHAIDDYQRHLVNRIKHHLEKRRRQWENKLQSQVDTIKGTSPDAPPVGLVFRTHSFDDDDLDLEENTECLSNLQQDNNDHLPIHVSSFKTYREDSGRQRHFLKVNISPFLPDGSVTVRTEYNGLTIEGENICSSCTKASKTARKMSHVVTKFVKLPDIVDLTSISVLPQQGGFLFIDVTTLAYRA